MAIHLVFLGISSCSSSESFSTARVDDMWCVFCFPFPFWTWYRVSDNRPKWQSQGHARAAIPSISDQSCSSILWALLFFCFCSCFPSSSSKHTINTKFHQMSHMWAQSPGPRVLRYVNVVRVCVCVCGSYTQTLDQEFMSFSFSLMPLRLSLGLSMNVDKKRSKNKVVFLRAWVWLGSVQQAIRGMWFSLWSVSGIGHNFQEQKITTLAWNQGHLSTENSFVKSHKKEKEKWRKSENMNTSWQI